MKHEPWFSSTGCPRDEEKPLLRLGLPSSKMNTSLILTKLDEDQKAFKAAFTSYNTAVQAQVALASLNQDQKDSLGFDKYIFSFSLLFVHSEITDYCYDQYFFINGLSIFFTFSLILLQHMIILSQGTLISLSIFSQDLQSPLCLYSLL